MKRAGQPPRLAVALLRLLAPGESRAPILGDLLEEYSQRAARSPRSAGRWYWRQVLGSAWPLTLNRLSSTTGGRWMTAGLLAVFLYTWIVCWDIWVARTGAGWAAQGAGPDDLVLVRLVYFHVFLAGAALGGALVSRIGWLRDQSFRSNSMRLLLPLTAILLWVLVDRLQAPAAQGAWLYLVCRSVLTLPAVLLGAALATGWRDRPGVS